MFPVIAPSLGSFEAVVMVQGYPSSIPAASDPSPTGRVLFEDARGRKLYLSLDMCQHPELREKLWLWFCDFPDDQERIRRWEFKLVSHNNVNPDLGSSEDECSLEDGAHVKIVWLPSWLGSDNFMPMKLQSRSRRSRRWESGTPSSASSFGEQDPDMPELVSPSDSAEDVDEGTYLDP